MLYPYRVAFTDGTVVDGEANTRDVVLWEVNFGKHHAALESEGVFMYEFAWLVHAAEKRQERTTLDLLEWLDTVDTVDPLEGEALVPLESTPPTGG